MGIVRYVCMRFGHRNDVALLAKVGTDLPINNGPARSIMGSSSRPTDRAVRLCVPSWHPNFAARKDRLCRVVDVFDF